MEDEQKYASYNALARKALTMGIPITTLLIFACLIMVTGFGGVILFGLAKGLITPLMLCIVLFIIKFKCESDSRAMEAVSWDIKGGLFRLRCKASVISFNSSDDSQTRRKNHVREWFKNNRAN
ncbi:VirB3 family type IV secretion system protein [uncultured Shewanella sp.]|uniref:VirB3 family type IV secretion system protein n=1 Tax=uncultured Shewanella sp. TaxID=173975 RepID=UPI002615FBB2|nr:VirB3 family type IV secretion system protein [uncultured Shewanella sp.]